MKLNENNLGYKGINAKRLKHKQVWYITIINNQL